MDVSELLEEVARLRRENRQDLSTINEIITALGGGDDDDPILLAKARMNEIHNLEDEIAVHESEYRSLEFERDDLAFRVSELEDEMADLEEEWRGRH